VMYCVDPTCLDNYHCGPRSEGVGTAALLSAGFYHANALPGHHGVGLNRYTTIIQLRGSLCSWAHAVALSCCVVSVLSHAVYQHNPHEIPSNNELFCLPCIASIIC
jgi:hypothetical protein